MSGQLEWEWQDIDTFEDAWGSPREPAFDFWWSWKGEVFLQKWYGTRSSYQFPKHFCDTSLQASEGSQGLWQHHGRRQPLQLPYWLGSSQTEAFHCSSVREMPVKRETGKVAIFSKCHLWVQVVQRWESVQLFSLAENGSLRGWSTSRIPRHKILNNSVHKVPGASSLVIFYCHEGSHLGSVLRRHLASFTAAVMRSSRNQLPFFFLSTSSLKWSRVILKQLAVADIK